MYDGLISTKYFNVSENIDHKWQEPETFNRSQCGTIQANEWISPNLVPWTFSVTLTTWRAISIDSLETSDKKIHKFGMTKSVLDRKLYHFFDLDGGTQTPINWPVYGMQWARRSVYPTADSCLARQEH